MNGFDEHLDNYGDPAPEVAPELPKLKFAMEEDDTDIRRYKRVHAWGCRDLRDPERLLAANELDLVDALISYGDLYPGEGVDELRPMLAPCARDLLDLEARRAERDA